MEEGALQVDVDLLVPAILQHVQERRRGLDAGVVDQHIDGAELLDGALHHGIHRGRIGHVGLDGDGPRTAGGQLAGQRLGFGFEAEVVHHHIGPSRAKGLGNGVPDPAARPRDDGDLALQLFRHRGH
jgi:hypothetical protein